LRKINPEKFSKTEKQGRPSAQRTVQWAPLAGVLVGWAILTVGLACLYLVMRTVGLENEGSCVSGGPYEIAPGHECEDGAFSLGYGGAFGLIVGFLIFLWSSHRYGGPLVVTSASGLGWSSLFGGLGGSFLSIGLEMPGSSDAGSEFKTVGIIFLAMASLGLALAFGAVPYSMRSGSLDYPKSTLGAWLAWFTAVAAGVVLGIVSLELARSIFD
jgi:hypothetical protein